MPTIPLAQDAARAPLSRPLHIRDLIPLHLPQLFQRAPLPVLPSPPLSSLSSTGTPITASQTPTHLLPRQIILTPIPTVYKDVNSSPAPGTVVGIVLGSVAGFLLLVWLFWTLLQSGRGGNIIVEEDVVVRRSRSPRNSRREMRQRSPQRIVVENRNIVEDRRGAPAVERERVVVEERVERRVNGDDIVEVIEEHSSVSPPRRKTSKKAGQYRTVDPGAFGGGDFPPRRYARR